MEDFDDDLHVDLTPLIDVIFMLVIFFIMTMSFALPTIDFLLPQSTTSQVSAERSDVFSLQINTSGQYFYEGRQITRQELIDLIKAADNPAIELAIDKNAPAQYLIDIADISREYSQGRLSISTVREEATAEQ